MKKCSTCKEVKPKSSFHKEKRKPDGLRSRCRVCRREKEPTRTEYNQRYYQSNSEEIKKRSKAWQTSNRNHRIRYMKLYSKTDKFKISKQNYALANREKTARYINEYHKMRRNIDPEFKILSNLRRRINKALHGEIKDLTTLELIGCTSKQLREHLESKFTDGMTWENYGPKGWHIDHIVPLSKYDLLDHDQMKKSCHYTNLQPLWWRDNILKGAS